MCRHLGWLGAPRAVSALSVVHARPIPAPLTS